MLMRLCCLLLACLALAGCWSTEPAPNPPPGNYGSSPKEFEVRLGGTLEHIKGAAVTAAFFSGAGARPLLGRTILPDENGSGRVVVISYRLWKDKFHADPSMLGSKLEVNGKTMTILGVMPKGFEFPDGAQLWAALPLQQGPS